MQKPSISELDSLISGEIKNFEMEVAKSELRRAHVAEIDRQTYLDRMLGKKTLPEAGETFNIGDVEAGVTSKSLWFGSRRVHYAALVSIAVGEGESSFFVDLNCTGA